METSEMRYGEIVGAVTKAINDGFDIDMTCADGIVQKITAGRITIRATTPQYNHNRLGLLPI